MEIVQLRKARREAFDLDHLELAPVEIFTLHLTLNGLFLIVPIFVLHVRNDHEALVFGLPLVAGISITVVASIVSVALRSTDMVSSPVALQRSKMLLILVVGI